MPVPEVVPGIDHGIIIFRTSAHRTAQVVEYLRPCLEAFAVESMVDGKDTDQFEVPETCHTVEDVKAAREALAAQAIGRVINPKLPPV